MSHIGFFQDNLALAATLSGTAGLVEERIVSRDLSLIDDPEGQHDIDGIGMPALVLWQGEGRPHKDYFPQNDDREPGTYAVVWHTYLPYDNVDGWQGRWDALHTAIRGVLLAAGALVAAERPGPPEVSWGEEPPLWMKNTTSPAGQELFYTVVMTEV